MSNTATDDQRILEQAVTRRLAMVIRSAEVGIDFLLVGLESGLSVGPAFPIDRERIRGVVQRLLAGALELRAIADEVETALERECR